jgi:hypothetical protein
MIVQQFATLRKYVQQHYQPPPQYDQTLAVYRRTPTYMDKEGAKKRNITPEEFVRRDMIVRQKWLDCTWKIGDVLTPVSEAARAQYGNTVVVENIYKSYNEVHEKEKWSTDDNPYLLSVRPEKGADGGRIICTIDFVMKALNGGTC